MALATGTAIALGIAAGTAVGGVAAAKSQSGAAKHAADVQAQSSDKALKYQTDRQTIEDKRYNDAWNDYLTRHKAWEQRNFGGGAAHGAGGGGGNPPSTFTPGPVPTLANLLIKPPATTPDQTQPEDQTKTTGWNDWGRYGAGGI